VDAHLARLGRRIVQTFNRSDVVRKRIAPRAESRADVRTQLSGLSDADLRGVMLPLRQPMESYGARAAQLAAQVAAGRGTLPPTVQQAAQAAALARLAQVETQNKRMLALPVAVPLWA
jgi:hypothetical protein